ELFERLGGTALKLGQQLAVRVDLLPYEVCAELDRLLDAVPPITLDAARREVERSLGRPIDEVFRSFGPDLLGSASIAVVFGAELRTGERVAVKVRRPGVVERILADVRVIELLTLAAEALTLVRPDQLRHLRDDLRAMLTDELDFRKEADFQVRFRQLAERDGVTWLTAPPVFGRWSTDAVLVSERVDGTSCAAIVDAVERHDAARLAELEARDIHPERLARRVMELSQWSRLECPFFQADPHPGNLLVLPGDRIVQLDFGSCGATTRDLRAQLVELTRRMLDEDFHSAAAMSIGMLSPLPLLDIEDLRYRIERALWRAHMPSLFDDAEWWERTSMGLWLAILGVTRDLNLPANPDVLRGVRANLLYDTLAHRLSPTLEKRRAVRRWTARAGARTHRRLRQEARRRGRKSLEREWEVMGAELAEIADKGRYTMAHTARHAPAHLQALSSAMGFAVAQLLHLAMGGTLLVAIGVVASFIWQRAASDATSPEELITRTLHHPAVWVLGAALSWIWYRRVQLRLRAREPARV
ncbi:MAG TPA: AarF/ABC1/UbiB kinase family protein, partial [Myxococcota bacterium]|nr:AarF/ABC1/UbiB kinase family protein [Myxococcota bacterium]